MSERVIERGQMDVSPFADASSFQEIINQAYEPELDVREQEARAAEQAAIARAKQGDHEAFSELYFLHAPSVSRWLARQNEPHTAEDLTQETFLRAFKSLDSFQDQGKGIGPWLQVIARNINMDNQRKPDVKRLQARDPETLPEQRTAGVDEEVIGRVALAQALKPALEKMNQEQRDVIEQVLIMDVPQTEYAEQTGIPLSTVRTRVFKGRKFLRKLQQRGQLDI